MTRPLDRSNLQSIVFQSHPCAHSRHFLFRFNDKAGGRRFLAEWVPRVTHGGIAIDPNDPPGPIVNIAIGWSGLDAVGAFDGLGGVGAAAQAFPFDFTDQPDGISMRAYGESAPENWWNRRFKSQDIGLTLHAYCTSTDQLESASAEIRESAKRNSLEELFPTGTGEAITGQALATATPGMRRLHFGYSDGFSQPQVNWDDDPALGRGPPPNGKGHYPRGYFIIDEWDDQAQSFPKSDPWRALVRHGSYVAFAWIHQDVASFNRFLRENAPKVARPGMSQAQAEEFLAAKLMGRWRDGTPLVLSPDRPREDLAGEDFDYSNDAAGFHCPVAAHVRIVNGRDRPLNAANQFMFRAGFPRVLRRGSSYGSWLDGEVDDGKDRGIAGMFICANVNKQFYPLARWIGTTNFSDDYKDSPTGQDPLFASRAVPNASSSFAIPTDDGPVVLEGLPDFIRIQGVAILFLPSLATLKTLST